MTLNIGTVESRRVDSNTHEEDWLVVQVQPRKEAYAAEHLRRQRFKTFSPRLRTTRIRARKFESALMPLFPGYLFVAIEPYCENWRAIKGTRGVLRLLCGDRGTPQRLPGGFVPALMTATDTMGVVSRQLFELRVGETARVVDGPFAHHVGRIAALDGKGRVDVMLEILGSCVPVGVASTRLQPQGAPTR